jgi:hypothetical protein
MTRVAWIGGVWLVLLAAVSAAPWLLGRPDPGDDLIRNTVRVSLLYYAAAAVLMTRLRPDEWSAAAAPGRTARLLWTLAWLAFLVHLAVSLHFFHHWSHAHVVQHTQEASGFGEGVYVSHFFTLAWTLDVLWWWLRPAGYARRSPWVDRLLHAFMAFIIFCGTVVYETGFIRWAGLAMFVILGAALAHRQIARRIPPSPLYSGERSRG